MHPAKQQSVNASNQSDRKRDNRQMRERERERGIVGATFG